MSQPVECASRERNIVLAGFMGCGKSTVGHALARLLHRRLVDTDRELVRRHGMDIATVFTRHGEERFREWEAHLALELAMDRNLVIAAGGGTLMNDIVFDELRVFGFVVYLRWPFEVLLERLRGTGKYRPLVDRYSEEGLRALFAEREPRYREADLEIQANGFSPDTIAKVVYHAFTS